MFEAETQAGVDYANTMLDREALPWTRYDAEAIWGRWNPIVFAGIGKLLAEGRRAGPLPTGREPDGAQHETAIDTLERLSLDMGKFVDFRRVNLNDFPGRVYLALQGAEPTTGGGSDADELVALRAERDALKARLAEIAKLAAG